MAVDSLSGHCKAVITHDLNAGRACYRCIDEVRLSHTIHVEVWFVIQRMAANL